MLLFKVKDIFVVNDDGIMLTPGFGDNLKFAKIGSKIKLVRPDKSIIETSIGGITFEGHHDIFIKNLNKKDVPIGTKVWLNE